MGKYPCQGLKLLPGFIYEAHEGSPMFRCYRVGGDGTASSSPLLDDWDLLSCVYKTHRNDLISVYCHFSLGLAV